MDFPASERIAGFFILKANMSLQDQVTADQQAVQAAQTALDAANAQLAADQAKLEAAAPHLSMLQKIEAYVGNLVPEVQDEFRSLIAEAKSLF